MLSSPSPIHFLVLWQKEHPLVFLARMVKSWLIRSSILISLNLWILSSTVCLVNSNISTSFTIGHHWVQASINILRRLLMPLPKYPSQYVNPKTQVSTPTSMNLVWQTWASTPHVCQYRLARSWTLSLYKLTPLGVGHVLVHLGYVESIRGGKGGSWTYSTLVCKASKHFYALKGCIS